MQMIYTSVKSKKKVNRKPGWQKAEQEYREWLQSMGVNPESKSKKKEFIAYKPEKSQNYRETKYIPSYGDGVGVATKKETMKYTGTLIKGIATMHKSNAVPIINDQEAKDISSMRR